MAEVDFSDDDTVMALLRSLSEEVTFAIGSRAAIRVLANIGRVEASRFSPLALASFRATLTSAVRGLGRAADMVWIRHASISAAASVVREVELAGPGSPQAAIYAARSTAISDRPDARFAAIIAGRSAMSLAESAELAPGLRPMEGDDARYRANAATVQDAENETVISYANPTWDKVRLPKDIQASHEYFLKVLAADRTNWRFWHDWYLGMWNGTFTDWDLATAVANIPDEFWEAGAEAVAGEIEKIKERLNRELPRPDNVPELESQKLTEHVKTLLASPEMTALAAESAGETLTRAITEYLKEAPANHLPDQLSHLESLPLLFRSISETIKSKEKSEAKAKRLLTQIEELNAKIAQLEAALKDARSKTVNGIFTQSALKVMGSAFGASVCGSLGFAVSYLFGEVPTDLVLENLRGWFSDVEKAVPKPDAVPSLPPSIDA